MHHLLEHINPDLKRRQSKDNDSTLHKTDYWSINPVGLTTAKASGPYDLINR